MFLLDTNVVSESRKHGDGRADVNVTAWFSSVDAVTLYISVITLMELEIGVLRMERRDSSQGARLHSWIDCYLRQEFIHRTLPVDTPVAIRSATLHVPNPRPERDALIAATALVHGMTVVTRNTADFEATGVALLNPWERH